MVLTNKQFSALVKSIRQISGLQRGLKKEDGKKIKRKALTWTSFPAHLHSSRREGEEGQDIYQSERERKRLKVKGERIFYFDLFRKYWLYTHTLSLFSSFSMLWLSIKPQRPTVVTYLFKADKYYTFTH